MKLKISVILALLLFVGISFTTAQNKELQTAPCKIVTLDGQMFKFFNGELEFKVKTIGIDEQIGILPIKEFNKVAAFYYVDDHWNIIYVDITFNRLNQTQVEVIMKDNYKYNAETGEVKKMSDAELESIPNKKPLAKLVLPVHVADGEEYEGVPFELKDNQFILEDIQG